MIATDDSNLPKIDVLLVGQVKHNADFCAAELENVKTAM